MKLSIDLIPKFKHKAPPGYSYEVEDFKRQQSAKDHGTPSRTAAILTVVNKVVPQSHQTFTEWIITTVVTHFDLLSIVSEHVF